MFSSPWGCPADIGGGGGGVTTTANASAPRARGPLRDWESSTEEKRFARGRLLEPLFQTPLSLGLT